MGLLFSGATSNLNYRTSGGRLLTQDFGETKMSNKEDSSDAKEDNIKIIDTLDLETSVTKEVFFLVFF